MSSPSMPKFDEKREYFNKWEMHKLLIRQSVDTCKIPETRMYSLQGLKKMLALHRDVYVKPIDTWGGKQISRLQLTSNGIVWDRESTNQPRRVGDYQKLNYALSTVHLLSKCIIQQTTPVLHFQKKPFDIRVHMQKDNLYQWVFAGALARVSGTSRIVSNVGISKGSIQPVSKVISTLFPKSPKIQLEIKESLPAIGLQICTALDEYQDFEEVGLDLGIDNLGRCWLYEVNTNDKLGAPSLELFQNLPSQNTYMEMNYRQLSRIISPI